LHCAEYAIMKQTVKKINTANFLVILITFVLFSFALFVKGITHDLLLETGIFLVSVKLILATYQIKIISQNIEDRLVEIEKALKNYDS